MEFSFEMLRKAALQEKQFGALAKLDEQFYAQCHDWMHSEEEKVSKDFSFESARNVENAKRLLKELVERRRHKIVLRLLNTNEPLEGLAAEEQVFADALRALFSNFDSAMAKGQEVKQIQHSVVTVPSSNGGKKVKFVQALPEFVASNGSPYGPFQAHEHAELPADVAAFLVKRGAAVLE